MASSIWCMTSRWIRRVACNVANRSNKRVQIFDQDGKFLGKWTDVGSPLGLSYVRAENALYMCVA